MIYTKINKTGYTMDNKEFALHAINIIGSKGYLFGKLLLLFFIIRVICEHLVLLADTPTALEIIMTNINKFEITSKFSIGFIGILILSNLFYIHTNKILHKEIEELKSDKEWLKNQINQREE